jgi:hypothetical protein
VLSHLFQTFCYILEGAIASFGKLRKILTTIVIGTVEMIATIFLQETIGITRTTCPADSADRVAARNAQPLIATTPALRRG